MAYKPNPNREIVDGKAKVSAKELADFQSEYGKDKTLRDLLNADKGLSRAPEFGVNRPRNSSVKDDTQIVKREGTTYSKPSIEEGGVKPKSRSSWDSTFGEDAEAGFKRAARGDSPFNDALMGAGQLAIAAMPVGKALRAARPLVGAAAQSFRESLKDIKEGVSPQKWSEERDLDRPIDQAINKVAADRTARELEYNTSVEDLPNTNPNKKYGQGQGFLGRTKDEFKKGGAVKKMASGGKVSGASSRGDGIAQRGRTKGRFV